MSSAAIIRLASVAHIAALGVWAGIVATEVVVETYPLRRNEAHSSVIRLHFWIDLLVELPIVLVVAVTGLSLVALTWPLSWLHVAKLACAAVALGANVACIGLVIRRFRCLESATEGTVLWDQTRRVRWCGQIGIPFGLAAAGLGLYLAFLRSGMSGP